MTECAADHERRWQEQCRWRRHRAGVVALTKAAPPPPRRAAGDDSDSFASLRSSTRPTRAVVSWLATWRMPRLRIRRESMMEFRLIARVGFERAGAIMRTCLSSFLRVSVAALLQDMGLDVAHAGAQPTDRSDEGGPLGHTDPGALHGDRAEVADSV